MNLNVIDSMEMPMDTKQNKTKIKLEIDGNALKKIKLDER